MCGLRALSNAVHLQRFDVRRVTRPAATDIAPDDGLRQLGGAAVQFIQFVGDGSLWGGGRHGPFMVASGSRGRSAVRFFKTSAARLTTVARGDLIDVETC